MLRHFLTPLHIELQEIHRAFKLLQPTCCVRNVEQSRDKLLSGANEVPNVTNVLMHLLNPTKLDGFSS